MSTPTTPTTPTAGTTARGPRTSGSPSRPLLVGGFAAAPLFLGLPAVQDAVRESARGGS